MRCYNPLLHVSYAPVGPKQSVPPALAAVLVGGHARVKISPAVCGLGGTYG